MTKDELLRLARDAHGEYEDAIAAVPDDRMLERGAVGEGWSVRDVMAHVGADEMWMAGQLEALAADTEPTAESCYGGEPPPPADFDLSTQDGRNAWQYARLRDMTLEDVRAMSKAAHARLMAAIQAMSEDVYEGELAIVPLGLVNRLIPSQAGEQAFPVWQWLRGVTFHHYNHHSADIIAFTGRTNASSDG
jgi:hypothetical protein